MNTQAKYCGFSMFVLGLATPLAFGQPVPADATSISPSSVMHFPWSEHTESSYIIYTDGKDFFSQDGKTGHIFCDDPNAHIVIQETIDQVNSEGGGRIFIKAGLYPLTTRVDIVACQSITIEGTDATVLSSTVGAALLIDQGSDSITLHRLTFRDCADKAINCKSGTNIRIIGCVFETIGSSAIQGRVGDDPNDPLVNVWIIRCRLTDVDLNNTGGRSARGGIYFYRTRNLYLHNNLVQRCGSIGISVVHSSSHVVCSNNIVRDNDQNAVVGQGHGIYVGACDHVVVSGNVVTGNGGNGFEGASGGHPLFVVTGNLFVGNGHNMVDPNEASGHYRNGLYITGRDHVVSNNVCRENWAAGIKVGHDDKPRHILVQNNICGNNNQGGDTRAFRGSGIVLNNPAPPDPNDPNSGGGVYDKVLVTHNLCYDDQQDAHGSPSPTQLYGIHCQNQVDGVLIESNRVYGNKDGQISYTATAGIIVRQNVGFVTESNGVVTVTASATGGSEVVTHGLNVAPVESLIHATPRSDLEGRSFWIDDINAASFTLYVGAGTGTGAYAFNWSYAAQ